MSNRDNIILHTGSTKLVHLPWTAPVDPTGDPVFAAFLAVGSVDPPSLVEAEWEVYSGSGPYWAMILVGAGTELDLPPGSYRMLSKVQDNPEAPLEECPNRLIVV